MKNKIGLIGIFNEISTSKVHHGYGYIQTLIVQLESLLNKEVIILNTESDLSDYSSLFIDEGVNFTNKAWNKIGGDFTKTLTKLDKLNKFEGEIFYNALKEIPDYQDLITKRKLNVQYVQKTFTPIDFILLTNKLVLGDSHSVSVHAPGFAMNTINGKSINGFLTEGLKSYVPNNIKHLRFYAGNIDIRFHFHRLNVALDLLVNDLEKQLLELNLQNVDIVQPLPIEDESRPLPGTGLYKGQPFYGTWDERNNIRTTFSNLLEAMCKKNNFTYLKWPSHFVDENKKLKFEIMEPRQSVHIKPIHYIDFAQQKKVDVDTLIPETLMKNKFERFNQYALECLDNYISINRINEKHFEATKSRTTFNTGDKYTDNVYLYHSINTRREGFKFLLEDYFLQENSLTFENHNLRANPNWDMYDYLFLIYAHRILGSGTSNEFNHGYNNSELIHFKNYNNHAEFLEYLNKSTEKFCSCCVNQPPRYNLKGLLTEHFRPFADHILTNIKPKMTITEIVKIMNDYNQANKLHRFNFHYLLMAGDLRDYCNLDTKIGGLFDIDMYVECPLGPSSGASMKILHPSHKYNDFINLCERYDMTPVDLEDLLCVWVKYIHNPIWEYYVKPEHTIADFENGWNVVERKSASYYKFKEKFNVTTKALF